MLREEKGCNLIIALTHAWIINDQALAKGVPGIDLILGGHDHDPYLENTKSEGYPKKDVPLIKSGYDFHGLAVIDISLGIDAESYEKAKSDADGSGKIFMYSEDDKMMLEIDQIDVDSKNFEPHQETAEATKAIMDELYRQMDVDVGYTGVEIEGRKPVIRT